MCVLLQGMTDTLSEMGRFQGMEMNMETAKTSKNTSFLLQWLFNVIINPIYSVAIILLQTVWNQIPLTNYNKIKHQDNEKPNIL